MVMIMLIIYLNATIALNVAKNSNVTLNKLLNIMLSKFIQKGRKTNEFKQQLNIK